MSLTHAQQLEGSAPDPLLADLSVEIERLISERDLEAAAARSREIAAGLPQSADAHALEARVAICQGRLADAAAAFRCALAIAPDHPRALLDLAAVLVHLDRAEEALPLVERLLGIDGGESAEARFLHGYLLSEMERPDDALATTEAGLARFPNCLELLSLRGGILRRLGRLTEALALQDGVLARNETFVPAWGEKGWILRDLGQTEAALAAFDRALALQPSFAAALSGKGLTYLDLERPTEALDAYERALVADSQAPEALFGRASALEKLRRFDEARAGYEALIEAKPDHVDAFDNLGNVYRSIGDLEAAEKATRQALMLDPDRPLTHSNLLFTLLYRQGVDAETLFATHRAFGDRFGNPSGRYRHWSNDRDPDRPLRVGVLSAELFRHALASWLMPFFEGRNPSKLTVVCYSMRVYEDEITERMRRLVDDWRVVVGLNDDELAEQIREDRIDILLEVSGHTFGNRLACLARKPAPVQAHWLGYPFTTGLDAIDYLIMDPVAVRQQDEAAFVETIVRLPGGRFCFQPPSYAPPVVGAPALRRGWVTFGSFNNLSKLTGRVLDAWAELMARVPFSRLVLKAVALDDVKAADRLRAELVSRGISPERFDLRGSSSYADTLRQYGDIDIALDPFPFGGGATSCDALWMGVPVVSLPDWQPVSRQTASFLHAIGRPEWVAEDIAGYIDIAARLAANPLRLQDLRSMQRDEMRFSPLCDSMRLGREMEAAMRWMWQRYLERSPEPREPTNGTAG